MAFFVSAHYLSRSNIRVQNITLLILSSSFFFNDTAPTEIYTLSLHDALPISPGGQHRHRGKVTHQPRRLLRRRGRRLGPDRSEEHTSELQSHSDLVCRLLLEKKKNNSLARLNNDVGLVRNGVCLLDPRTSNGI